MSNNFQFQVIALDRFTKTFRNLNNQASKAVRPLVSVHRQVGALARELHLDKMAKGMGKVSGAAVNLTRTLGLSLGPLEAVLGAGGIVGGLLAAGGAAVALGVRFANSGFEVDRTAQRLGVATRDLQGYRGAARLAGLDADTMTSAISNLGDTLEDAKFGRNPVALQVLNRFGIAIRENRDGTIDTIGNMKDLARVLQETADPHVQKIIASAFGLDEALPLLRQGPAAIDALAKEAERLGLVAGPSALKWADDFTTSLNHMKASIDGAANSLGASLVPGLTRAMDAISKGFDTGGLRGGVSKVLSNIPGAPLLRLAGNLIGMGAGDTTRDQRTVSGAIGGPLGQGAYVAPFGTGNGYNAPVAGTDQGGLIDGRYVDPAVQAARDREGLGIVQGELAGATNPGDRDALTREIARRTSALASGPQSLNINLAIQGAPSGMTATARNSSSNASVTTRVSYAMPTADMP